MYVYRQLLNNHARFYIANIVCCSSVKILVFKVYMGIFLELLSFGCYVEIQHYEAYIIVSHAARLDQTDIALLL